MKKISLFITKLQFDALHAWCNETGLKFSELIRRIVDEALRQRRQEVRQEREERQEAAREL